MAIVQICLATLPGIQVYAPAQLMSGINMSKLPNPASQVATSLESQMSCCLAHLDNELTALPKVTGSSGIVWINTAGSAVDACHFLAEIIIA